MESAENKPSLLDTLFGWFKSPAKKEKPAQEFHSPPMRSKLRLYQSPESDLGELSSLTLKKNRMSLKNASQ